MNSSTNLDESAIAAAAELRLNGIRQKRINAAEKVLAKAKDALAAAQQEESEAAKAYSLFPSTGTADAFGGGAIGRPGNRERLLQARENVTLAEAVAQHADSELTRAKARFKPDELDAAKRLVKAERQCATLREDIDPTLVEIAKAAAQMITLYRKVIERVGQQGHHRFDQKEATEDLGMQFPDTLLSHGAPNPFLLCAESILKACQDSGFSPFDWQEMDPRKVYAPRALPEIEIVLNANANADRLERNARWQRQLHAEAAANSAAR